MKPIACSNAAQPKPFLPPKPVVYRTPSLASAPPDQTKQPGQGTPSAPGPDKHQAPTAVTVSPRHNRDRRARAKPPKSLPNGTDKRTKPSRNDDHCSEFEGISVEQDYSLNIKKPSGTPPNVDFSVLRETRNSEPSGAGERKDSDQQQQGKSPDKVTSLDANSPTLGVGDVIYDEPFSEFERKSWQRMIRSDGYVKIGTDAVDAADSLRKVAQKYRKFSFRGADDNKRTLNNTDMPKNGLRPCWSSESVDQLDVLLDFSDCSNHVFAAGKPLRSSFVDPNGPPTRKSVYIELGEYQTLLKHSRNEEERVYSLPQPQCYGEDTLRAVKLITEKYDTFKRRQLRALSFREGTCLTRISQDESKEGNASTDGPLPLTTSSAMGCLDETAVLAKNTNHTEFNSDSVAPTPEADSVPLEVDCLPKEVAVEKTSKSKQPGGWLSLRDYCNTLAIDADACDVSSGGLSKSNLMRIELFYRSRESSVYVCRCLADMLVGTALSDDSCPSVHQHTGVPVWVLNSGLGVRSRELLLVLAERETGFPLWQDKINYLSNYHALSSGVHSLRVSGSLRKMVRLHMFCERSGDEFLARFHEISSDPQDDLWKVSTDDRRLRKSGKRKTRLKLSKSSISQPCNFVHISCVDPMDPNFRAAFSGLIPVSKGASPTSATVEHKNASERVNDSSECEFRPRLPTR